MKNSLITIAPNPNQDIGLEFSKELKKRLEAQGYRTEILPVAPYEKEKEQLLSEDERLNSAGLLIPVGGDGTFIHVARNVMGRDVPILGVNMGKLGFISSVEKDEFDLILRAAGGKYRRSRRMLLDSEVVRAGEIVYSETAVNEVVIKSDVSCIGLGIMADKERMFNFSGDGVIVATPTGSTAYSMSAGGPLVEPEAENILVTPICAHNFVSASFVLSDERAVKVTPEFRQGMRVLISADGLNGIDFLGGETVFVRKSKKSIIIADMEVRGFYEKVFNKLMPNRE